MRVLRVVRGIEVKSYAISRALVTRTDAATRPQSFGPPRPAHQRGAPLTTSARHAWSSPPTLSFWASGSLARIVVAKRELSASVCRALPATPRATFKRCETGRVHWTSHMRDRPRSRCRIPVVERPACRSGVSGALTVSGEDGPLPCSDLRARAASQALRYDVVQVLLMLATWTRA